MNNYLRFYDAFELGADGYPFAWHRGSALTPDGARLPVNLLAAGEDRIAERPPIKDYVREEAGHRCLRCGHPYRAGEVVERGEWSPCDEECRHGGPVRVRESRGEGTRESPLEVLDEAQWRILTVHHLDEDKANCCWWNLAALCQRCHLRMQRAVVMGRPYHFEHSAWFKPYAAGFYAWKYLGEDLERVTVEVRMEELLQLEHRFTQETLL